MQTKITQAILPVAGRGTRFLPWTSIVPKELLPLGKKPVIAHLVDECLSVGIHDICFVLGHGKEAIRNFFRPPVTFINELRTCNMEAEIAELQKYQDVHFSYVYQDQQLGDGHAIMQAANWVSAKSDHIAVLFGDDLIVGEKNGLQQLIQAHQELPDDIESAAMLCLERIELENASRYGIVKIDQDSAQRRLHRIQGLVEKPKPEDAPSKLAIVGKYLIPRSTIDILPHMKQVTGNEIRLIDALTLQLASTPIYGYEAKGTRYDTGTPEGWKKAVAALA